MRHRVNELQVFQFGLEETSRYPSHCEKKNNKHVCRNRIELLLPIIHSFIRKNCQLRDCLVQMIDQCELNFTNLGQTMFYTALGESASEIKGFHERVTVQVFVRVLVHSWRNELWKVDKGGGRGKSLAVGACHRFCRPRSQVVEGW